LEEFWKANPYLVQPGQSLANAFRVDAIPASARDINEKLLDELAQLAPPASLQEMRDAYSKGLLGLPSAPKSPRARTITIDGPGGPLSLRVLVPEQVRGVYLHFHGGGWTAGSNDTWDAQLEFFGRQAGMASVSIDYRLAPEHPAPAAIDDCVAAASWLIEHAQAEFGTTWLSIGGESAGSNLAALTLIRLRELGHAGAFRAASLLFGCFDLSLTPSVRMAKTAAFVNYENMQHFSAGFVGNYDRRDPTISPLYADLTSLPPALFSVGSIDPLLDDTLFMYMRWQAAANTAYLAVYPGGTHGFNSFEGELATAGNSGIASFLRLMRDSDPT